MVRPRRREVGLTRESMMEEMMDVSRPRTSNDVSLRETVCRSLILHCYRDRKWSHISTPNEMRSPCSMIE